MMHLEVYIYIYIYAIGILLSCCVANSEFPLTNDFSGHKIFMKIVHYPV